MKANKETLSYLVTIFLSILVLWFGWLYVKDGAEFFQNTSGEAHEEFLCRVLEVTDENQKVSALGDMYYLERFIEFDAEILRGERKGNIIPVVQTIDNVSTLGVEPVEKGDRLFVYLQSEENGEPSSNFPCKASSSSSILWIGCSNLPWMASSSSSIR